MDRRRRIGIGLTAAMLLGAAALALPRGSGGGAEGPCSLLAVSEIEEQFGGSGPVSEGERRGVGCAWEVGQGATPGTVLVTVSPAVPGRSIEETVIQPGSEPPAGLEPIPLRVPGVEWGDALYDRLGTLWVRVDDRIVSVTAWVNPVEVGYESKLVALARLAAERL